MSTFLLSRTAENLGIRRVRGKYVISTMPTKWIFGKANTLLECDKCMRDATWRGVLIGPCISCSVVYHGVPNGFPEKASSDAMPMGGSPFYGDGLGFYIKQVCDKIDELLASNDPELANIPSRAQPINHNDAYSFYGLASLGNYTSDSIQICESEDAIEIMCARYKCASPALRRWTSITSCITNLSSVFDPFSVDFFKKCEKMEKKWIKNSSASTQEEVEEANMQRKRARLHDCYYCGNRGVTMLCGKCKTMRYCSVACQYRDWTKGGAYTCANEQPSDPHKASCEYLAELQKEQREYETMSGLEMGDDVVSDNDEINLD